MDFDVRFEAAFWSNYQARIQGRETRKMRKLVAKIDKLEAKMKKAEPTQFSEDTWMTLSRKQTFAKYEYVLHAKHLLGEL